MTQPERDRLLERVGAIPRGSEELVQAAAERVRRRAAGVSAMLGIGVVGLVVSWSRGSILGAEAPDQLVPTLAVLLASAWCGYRIAEWRLMRRIERLLDEGDPTE